MLLSVGTACGQCIDVRAFTIFIADDRYEVATMVLVHAENEGRLTALVRERLDESPHHQAIEVFEHDRPIALFDREGVVWAQALGR